ncbi:MAG: winged helix-turn-helix transcriptional regulator [Polyangiaceae bacterium]|nr:winged helix-turn-helix transcriptional regulator [Polyangiaceae bacterium]
MKVERSSQLDHTLLALADPTRRRILARLSKGEARVTELAAPLPMSLNAVSKHIKVLERAKLVRRNVRGRDHYLSLDARPLDQAALWIETQRAQWSQRLRKLDELLQEEDRK